MQWPVVAAAAARECQLGRGSLPVFLAAASCLAHVLLVVLQTHQTVVTAIVRLLRRMLALLLPKRVLLQSHFFTVVLTPLQAIFTTAALTFGYSHPYPETTALLAVHCIIMAALAITSSLAGRPANVATFWVLAAWQTMQVGTLSCS